MEVLEVIRAIIGFFLVMFIPGYAATWALFPDDKEIDLIERIALAIGLSIALVVLIIYVLNVTVGVKINMINSLIIICLITFSCTGIYFLRNNPEEKEMIESEPVEKKLRRKTVKKAEK